MTFEIDDGPGKDEKPYCRLHYCAMERYASKKASGRVHYRCKVKGCKERQSVVKAALRIPTKPTICPVCGGSMTVRSYAPFFVVLECLGKFDNGLDCGHTTEIARPDIEAKLRNFRG